MRNARNVESMSDMERIHEINNEVDRMKATIESIKRCPAIPDREKIEKVQELTASLRDVQAAAAMYMAMELEAELGKVA